MTQDVPDAPRDSDRAGPRIRPRSLCLFLLGGGVGLVAAWSHPAWDLVAVLLLTPIALILAADNLGLAAGVLVLWGLSTLGVGASRPDAESTRPQRLHVAVEATLMGLAAGLFRRWRDATDAARRAAVTDPLTGLWNRTGLLHRLDEELARAAREQKPLAVGVLDIDRFKTLNDRRGHAAGDRALVDVAALLRQSVRKYDFVARLGGDEFALLLPGVDSTGAHAIAARLLAAIRDASRTTDGHITASLGIAIVEPGAPLVEATELIRQADQWMYRAKQSGRDRCELGSATIAPH